MPEEEDPMFFGSEKSGAVDHVCLAFAGLTECWNGPDGPVHSCAIITTDANERMREIHNRMPVILAPDDHAAWLDPGNQATAKLKELLKPCPAGMMAAHAVSLRVNTPKNDEPALLEPVAE